MRWLITGIDANGKSAVISETTADDTVDGDIQRIFRTPCPPPVAASGNEAVAQLGVPAGHLEWWIVRWPAGRRTEASHRTDTVDFNIVLDGSIDLILDDGAHRLEQGDGAAVTGVGHGWVAGPDGAMLASVIVAALSPALSSRNTAFSGPPRADAPSNRGR